MRFASCMLRDTPEAVGQSGSEPISAGDVGAARLWVTAWPHGPLHRLAPRAISVSSTRQRGTCDALPSKLVDKTNGSNPESQMALPTATKMKRILNTSFFQRLWRTD